MTYTVGQNGIATFLLILDTFLCTALHVAATGGNCEGMLVSVQDALYRTHAPVELLHLKASKCILHWPYLPPCQRQPINAGTHAKPLQSL